MVFTMGSIVLHITRQRQSLVLDVKNYPLDKIFIIIMIIISLSIMMDILSFLLYSLRDLVARR